jgi:TIR domain
VTGDSSGSDLVRFASHEGDPQSLRIFICYRREDSAANAGRIADALVERFGRNSVFMDVDTIEPGVDFNDEIARAIGQCDVLIALIGPRWLESANARGRRLDDPQDFVRVEIGHALDRNIRVIPTLVGGAEMPEADELPDDLVKLAKRNAVELTDKRFRSDMQALLEPLDRIAQQKRDVALPAAAVFVAPPNRHGEVMAVATEQPVPPLVTVVPQGVPHGDKRAPARKGRRMLPLVAVLVAVALLIAAAGVLALNRRGTNGVASKPTNLLSLPAGYTGSWRGTGHEFSPAADFALVVTMSTGKIGSKVGAIDRPSFGGSCHQDLTLDKATTQSITMTENGGYCGAFAAGTKIVASLSGASMSWYEYQTDPSAGNPMAKAILSQAGSGAIPGTSNLVALPDGYVGTWKGSAHEISPSADYAIILTVQSGEIGTVVGHLNRPSLGGSCQQDLTLDKATTQSITLTENGGYCGAVAAGTKIVASLGDASMSWNEYQADPSSGNAMASAILTQASSGAIPGTSNLVALPDGYPGTWKGSAHEISPSSDYALIMTMQAGQIGTVVGHIDRPSLGGSCQQDLILDKATSQSITLTENGGYCGAVAVGTKIVASLSGASMSWNEYQADPLSGNPMATATLAMTT